MSENVKKSKKFKKFNKMCWQFERTCYNEFINKQEQSKEKRTVQWEENFKSKNKSFEKEKGPMGT